MYLTSFSKTLAPSLKVGAVTLPDTLFGDRDARKVLMRDLVERKGFATPNSNCLGQAIVGGILLEQNFSLRSWVSDAHRQYRCNRDAMLYYLDREFKGMRDLVHWNRPDGGFFIYLALPFPFTTDSIVDCALNHDVIATPLSFFSPDNSQDHLVRLAFSSLSTAQLEAGVSRFARYVETRLVPVASGARLPVQSAQ